MCFHTTYYRNIPKVIEFTTIKIGCTCKGEKDDPSFFRKLTDLGCGVILELIKQRPVTVCQFEVGVGAIHPYIINEVGQWRSTKPDCLVYSTHTVIPGDTSIVMSMSSMQRAQTF